MNSVSGDALARRLFIALPLPAPVRAEINALVHVLRRQATGVRWVRTDHLHATLRFLGDVEEAVEKSLIEALEAVTHVPPFRYNLAGVGAFPDRKRPRVIWTGIRSGKDDVANLAAVVEESVVHAGFEPERRRYSPHITLGRVRQPGDFQALWRQAESMHFEGKDIRATEVRLIWSTLTPKGPVYRDVESFPLRGSEVKS